MRLSARRRRPHCDARPDQWCHHRFADRNVKRRFPHRLAPEVRETRLVFRIHVKARLHPF
jgi:hypothetical protein